MKISDWTKYFKEPKRMFLPDFIAKKTKKLWFGDSSKSHHLFIEENELFDIFKNFIEKYKYEKSNNKYYATISLQEIGGDGRLEVLTVGGFSFDNKVDDPNPLPVQYDKVVYNTIQDKHLKILQNFLSRENWKFPNMNNEDDKTKNIFDYLLQNNKKEVDISTPYNKNSKFKVEIEFYNKYEKTGKSNTLHHNWKPFANANLKEAFVDFRKLFAGNVSKLVKAMEKGDNDALDKLFTPLFKSLSTALQTEKNPDDKQRKLMNRYIDDIKDQIKNMHKFPPYIHLQSSTAEYHGRNVMILFTAIAAIGALAALCTRFADTKLVGNLLNKMDFRSSSSGIGQVMQNIAKFATEHKGQSLYVAGGLGFATMASMTTARVLDLKRHDKEYSNADSLLNHLLHAKQKV